MATRVETFSKIAGPIPGSLRSVPSATAAATSPGKAATVRAAWAYARILNSFPPESRSSRAISSRSAATSALFRRGTRRERDRGRSGGSETSPRARPGERRPAGA